MGNPVYRSQQSLVQCPRHFVDPFSTWLPIGCDGLFQHCCLSALKCSGGHLNISVMSGLCLCPNVEVAVGQIRVWEQDKHRHAARCYTWASEHTRVQLKLQFRVQLKLKFKCHYILLHLHTTFHMNTLLHSCDGWVSCICWCFL